MIYGIIYCAICVKNMKRYIGQTVGKLNKRKNHHIYKAKIGSTLYFHTALRKYGKESFIWEEIDKAFSKEDLDNKEKYYINFYHTQDKKLGYNISDGGYHWEMVE
jgi:group I intron endonuclease